MLFISAMSYENVLKVVPSRDSLTILYWRLSIKVKQFRKSRPTYRTDAYTITKT